MTWLLIRNPHGTALVEHHALAGPSDTVVSRHASYPEACAALVKYRERQEREELEAAGQKGLFDDAP